MRLESVESLSLSHSCIRDRSGRVKSYPCNRIIKALRLLASQLFLVSRKADTRQAARGLYKILRNLAGVIKSREKVQLQVREVFPRHGFAHLNRETRAKLRSIRCELRRNLLEVTERRERRRIGDSAVLSIWRESRYEFRGVDPAAKNVY